MTRILLDAGELAEAAAQLDGVAGEYEAIGALIVSCDCGCMPSDVAATVDGATASIRSRLRGIASALVNQGTELEQRAGIPQDGRAASAVGAAHGDASSEVVPDSYVTVDSSSGFDFAALFNPAPSSVNVITGDPFLTLFNPAPSASVVKGGDFSAFGLGGGASSSVVSGGDFSAFGLGGGASSSVVGGGDFSLFGLGGDGSSSTIDIRSSILERMMAEPGWSPISDLGGDGTWGNPIIIPHVRNPDGQLPTVTSMLIHEYGRPGGTFDRIFNSHPF